MDIECIQKRLRTSSIFYRRAILPRKVVFGYDVHLGNVCVSTGKGMINEKGLRQNDERMISQMNLHFRI